MRTDQDGIKIYKILYKQQEVDIKIINNGVSIFTSLFRHEGKSTIINLVANSLYLLNKKIIVIDCDTRKIKQNLNGIYEYLYNKVILNDILDNLILYPIITSGNMKNNIKNFFRNDSEKEKFKILLEELKKQYDYILIDTPPIHEFTDAIDISCFCDSVILIKDYYKINNNLNPTDIERLKKLNISLEILNYTQNCGGNNNEYYQI